MRIATKSDQQLVEEIVTEAFYLNPSVNAVVKAKDPALRRKKVKNLARYAFNTALPRQGVFLSQDDQGVAICYRYNAKKESIQDYWNQLQLATGTIGLKHVRNVLKRESYVKSQRPAHGDFLYFWFFGATEKGKGRGAAIELRDAIFQQAEETGLPIYLETSITKNKRVYERYGFEVYHVWEQNNQPLWFMRRG